MEGLTDNNSEIIDDYEGEVFSVVRVGEPTVEQHLSLYKIYLGMGGEPMKPYDDMLMEHEGLTPADFSPLPEPKPSLGRRVLNFLQG